MAFLMLPIIVVVFFFSLAQDQAQRVQFMASSEAPSAQVEGQVFIAYRNACANYAIANSAFTGSIPQNAVPMPPGILIPSGYANTVAAVGGGRQVRVWANLPSGSVYQAVNALGGDMSIGQVQGTQWVSPVYGNLGVTPTGVPSGDALSVIQLSP